jgi:hypothetical protein
MSNLTKNCTAPVGCRSDPEEIDRELIASVARGDRAVAA